MSGFHVMGIVNVTPDSFSDGGRWFDPQRAISHGVELARQGASIIDVGGESTRPGAERIDVTEEQRRVLPVIRALAEQGIAVSVDTMWAPTARAAVQAGASYVNDVSGGLADPAMIPAVRDLDAAYIVSHWRGHLGDGVDRSHYGDVVREVVDEVARSVDACETAGIERARLIVDPGLGFSKQGRHNWQILQHLDAWSAIGLPILVGASRKRFVSDLVPAVDPSSDAGLVARDAATALISARMYRAGVWGVRVHDVAATAAALAAERKLGSLMPAIDGGARI